MNIFLMLLVHILIGGIISWVIAMVTMNKIIKKSGVYLLFNDQQINELFVCCLKHIHNVVDPAYNEVDKNEKLIIILINILTNLIIWPIWLSQTCIPILKESMEAAIHEMYLKESK